MDARSAGINDNKLQQDHVSVATAEQVQEKHRTGPREDKASAGAVTLRTIEPVMPWIVVAVVLQVLGSVLSAVQFLALAELAVRLVSGGADWDASKGPLFCSSSRWGRRSRSVRSPC